MKIRHKFRLKKKKKRPNIESNRIEYKQRKTKHMFGFDHEIEILLNKFLFHFVCLKLKIILHVAVLNVKNFWQMFC